METYVEPATEKRFVHFIYNGAPLRLPLSDTHPADASFYRWEALMDMVGPSLIRHEEFASVCQERK